MNALHDLARKAGLSVDWEDALGAPQRVAPDALVAVLEALDLPARSQADITESMARLAADDDAECGYVTGTIGEAVDLPRNCRSEQPCELVLEDGERRGVVLQPTPSGARLPAIHRPGYHRLHIGDREVMVAIAPPGCFRVSDAAGDRRIWGPAVQIPALRSQGATPYGDFRALADTARAFASRGADALAVSPVHALFPADASRYSPYAPSSRLFLNVLYADATLVGIDIPERTVPDLIDWTSAVPERMRLLRQGYDQKREALRRQITAYAAAGGRELERHACFDALHAWFFQKTGARSWMDWPSEYQNPDGPAVRRFSEERANDVGFYLFLQWLAAQSLDLAQKAAIDSGMALGLIADLAIGLDAGGSQAWSRGGDLLTGMSIGAPPDLLGPDGQDWGITGFSPRALKREGFEPFLATLRAALRHAGGIRIDHALGLRRLWVIPNGASSREGAYLAMPQDDMLRLLALESHRAGAVVIGEDLGTVPQGFRPTMEEKAILGMKVLWFERDEGGGFIPSDQWPENAAAMTGTHDLPTVAGWWRGRDIDWTWKLGRASRAESEPMERQQRAEERSRLWTALEASGAAAGPAPNSEETRPVVDAALRFIGNTPCSLAIIPLEDIAGLPEQPNLPGTIDEHPNWRRRMPEPTHVLLDRPEIRRRLDALNTARIA